MPSTHSNGFTASEAVTGIPMGHGLALAGILFAIGLCGVMVRRNFLFMLMSLEIMMNAAALAFVVAGSRWASPDGQVMFIFILTLAAAEASIGLAILLQFYHKRGHLDVDSANEMKG
ncbi:NADH-quinone oxidoreductase subunit NuoK [Psychrobacter sp. I-STPA6b]|uniref:NADH-quinone oxidoreductase subunit NuoK n=1 Tax=Psychrobacter sp. I-STPA6b TaxID=2585718 RepID=UPI002221C9CB